MELESPEARLGYTVGQQIGTNLRRDGLSISEEALFEGIHDAMSAAEPKLTQSEQQAVLKQAATQRSNAVQESAATNKAAGERYLEANREKDGVLVTDSGLQYQVMTEGSGSSPAATDSVTVHYRGTTIDGAEFDSSYKRGEPATFGVNQVIQGWQETLPMMKPGSKWEIVIPSDLAYGERGAGAAIGPNSTLIFEIELLSVN